MLSGFILILLISTVPPSPRSRPLLHQTEAAVTVAVSFIRAFVKLRCSPFVLINVTSLRRWLNTGLHTVGPLQKYARPLGSARAGTVATPNVPCKLTGHNYFEECDAHSVLLIFLFKITPTKHLNYYDRNGVEAFLYCQLEGAVGDETVTLARQQSTDIFFLPFFLVR